MKRDKKFLLGQVLTLIKQGLAPAQIAKKLELSKQNINYYVAKLKKQGCAERVAYGTWRYIKPLKEVKDLTIGQYNKYSKKEIRGHAFIWKIEFEKPFNWEKVILNYSGKTLKFQRIFNKKVYRTIFQNRKIWLTKKGIIIYEPIDFMGNSSFEVKGLAVYDMDLLLKNLLRVLNLKIKPYRFTTSREHYGMIRNELARQYNNKKEKMHIQAADGGTWLWIDDSKGLGELETADPTISRQVQNFWNDHKKHKFEVTPTFVLEGFNRQTENLDNYIKHLAAHVESVQILGKAAGDNAETVKVLSDVVLDLRREVKNLHRK